MRHLSVTNFNRKPKTLGPEKPLNLLESALGPGDRIQSPGTIRFLKVNRATAFTEWCQSNARTLRDMDFYGMFLFL